MNSSLKSFVGFTTAISLLILLDSCKNDISKNEVTQIAVSDTVSKPLQLSQKLTEEFKNYWYDGEAEVTSYTLEQARYGEIHNGRAVLVFVTEDFLADQQVKADHYSDSNIPILKLNATKKFNTGIYPYSIMQSTFFPVANNNHAIKIASSVQEWCGQVYSQLNNKDNFEVTSHSYFQGEADESYSLEKTWTENELWTKLRVEPQSLPIGEIQIIPALEFTQLKHKSLRAYTALATFKNGSYTLSYPELNRTLHINFNSNFPYDILSWEEISMSGYGANAQTLITKAQKIKTIKSAYWTKNNKADQVLRETLELQ